MFQPNPTPQNLFWDVHYVCMWYGSHGSKDLRRKLKKGIDAVVYKAK